MKLTKQAALFSLGGGAYVGLELLYRGRSHASMFAAGGTCFLIAGKLRQSRLPFMARGLLGAGAITAVELATGLLVNRDHRVWDYRSQPGNIRGQICPLFTAIWFPLSLTAMGLYGWLDEKWDTLVFPK